MITYDQIKAASDGILTTNIKGKEYAAVNGRINAFRRLFPQGFITTEIVSLEAGVVVMKASCGYYEDGQAVVLGTGMAYEREGSSNINKTSYIENCETSAVGRALGMIGLGLNGGGICSAEELANALVAQRQNEEEFQKTKAEIEEKKMAAMDAEMKKAKKSAPAAVETVDAVPGW